jgi:hypothetical protein
MLNETTPITFIRGAIYTPTYIWAHSVLHKAHKEYDPLQKGRKLPLPRWLIRLLIKKQSPFIEYCLQRMYEEDERNASPFQIWLLSTYPELTPTLAKIYRSTGHDVFYPGDPNLAEEEDGSTDIPVNNNDPKKRSILFIHHCYYNFYYLAKALRKRGWDAICVSAESPKSPSYQFYHGEDLNLFDEDPNKFKENIASFYNMAKKRFRMVHFYGAGSTSFYPRWFHGGLSYIPWDFLELKRRGIKIGYSQSGCNDLARKSAFYEWSKGSCERCAWKDNPDVCSDKRNGDWGTKLTLLSDLICVETDPTIDFKGGEKVYFEPLTFAVDSELWTDNLEIPAQFKLEKGPGEILIYHSVGNYKARTVADINYKGSEAITAAVERLQQEGFPIRLVFVDNMNSRDVRFIQAQCDIAVDQLNYGRYGANARELMLLGVPVICHIRTDNPGRYPLSKCIEETPIINANLDNIYDVLKYYVENQHLLPELKKKAREHALHWWSADKCAERFERVYDALMNGESYDEIRKIL